MPVDPVPSDLDRERPSEVERGRLSDLERERDQTGRPRNARPRDELGRPLPRGGSGVAGVPDDLVLSPPETLREAQRLLDAGRPFHAHEVLEAAWKSAPDAERDLWQGLAQLAVGLTHALRGNTIGAPTLLLRGADRISDYAEAPPYGIDVTGLLEWATALAGQLGDPSSAGPSSDRGPSDDAGPRTPQLVIDKRKGEL